MENNSVDKSRICGITEDNKEVTPQSLGVCIVPNFRYLSTCSVQIYRAQYGTTIFNWCLSMVHQNDSQKIAQPSGAYFGYLGH